MKFNETLSTSNPQYQTETCPKTYHASKILLCRTTSNHPVRQTFGLNKRKTGKLLPSLYSCAHRVKEAIALLLDNIASLQRPSPLRLRPSCETVVRGEKTKKLGARKKKEYKKKETKKRLVRISDAELFARGSIARKKGRETGSGLSLSSMDLVNGRSRRYSASHGQ